MSVQTLGASTHLHRAPYASTSVLTQEPRKHYTLGQAPPTGAPYPRPDPAYGSTIRYAYGSTVHQAGPRLR
eukprot:2180158-Rhodomonas_salina.2